MQKAWQSKTLADKKVQCLACNHYCQIGEGKAGICGVRVNRGGELQLLVYGKAASVNIDPIEKKPLYHFLPNSNILSFGTVGCNFRCSFCQNFDISQFPKEHNSSEVQNFGVDLLPEKIVEMCLEENITSIAYTYNEPAIFFEYAYDTAKLAHEKGIKNVFVSNGFESREALEKIHPYLDAINVDLKSFREDFYAKICGGRLQPVLENIKWLVKNNIWVEITTLIITDENDSEKELKQIAEFIASIDPNIPWHISRYFPAYQMDNPPTPIATLEHAAEIGKQAGFRGLDTSHHSKNNAPLPSSNPLNFVYIGNLTNSGFENTICPKCNETVIERSGYMTQNLLEKNRCCKCQQVIPGVFN